MIEPDAVNRSRAAGGVRSRTRHARARATKLSFEELAGLIDERLDLRAIGRLGNLGEID